MYLTVQQFFYMVGKYLVLNFFFSHTLNVEEEWFNEAVKYLLSTAVLLGRPNKRLNDASKDFQLLENDDPRQLTGNREG